MKPSLARLLVRLGLRGPDRLRVAVRAAPLRVDAPLVVATTSGDRRTVTFRVDSGCSLSTIGLAYAQAVQLPTEGRRIRRRRITGAGERTVVVRHGRFRFWLTEDQRAAPFVAEIDFEENQPEGVPPLLGLKGIIDQIHWTFDGRFRPDEPYGFGLLRDQRPAAQRYPS